MICVDTTFLVDLWREAKNESGAARRLLRGHEGELFAVPAHAAGEFLESAEYIGEKYGTPLRPVEEALARGQNVVMEIDVQGGMKVAEKMPDSIRIFVLPPDAQSLKARLEGRRTEAAEQLTRRLAKADGEIAVARDSGCYQHFVINDVLDVTITQVIEIVQKETGLA